MSPIRWASAAADDLRDISAYLAQDSPSAATTFVERVDRAVRRLSGQPRSGRVVPELERQGINRYREVVLSPWRLFYRYEQETLFILALIDGRRDIQDILLWRLMRDEPQGDR
jgi:plasmid stabilization system protein ParE